MRLLNNLSAIFLLFSILIFSNCKKDKEEVVALKQCEITDLVAESGDCNPNGTYRLDLSFEYSDTGNDKFNVFIRNNELLGTFELSSLPITIDEFVPSGFDFDYLKVCIDENRDCCKEIEFLSPDCRGDTSDVCKIFGLELEIGDCCPGDLEAYELKLNFDHVNLNNDFFDLFVRNNELIGTHRVDQLPISIEKFPMSGNLYDFIRICVNDNPDCCIVKEFESPDCGSARCSISNFELQVGNCTCDDAYNLTVKFDYENSNSDYFDVYVRNNEYIGSYRLDQLPVTIENFPVSGNPDDLIQVVLNNDQECSIVKEFTSPDCDDHDNGCSIYNLAIDIGDCTSKTTYNLFVNFDHTNAGNDFFDLYTLDGFLGFYRLDELPLKIENFRLSGNDFDYLKVCINDNPNCCKEIEWQAPECDDNPDDCKITNLNVRVGDCISPEKYNLWVSFDFENPTSDKFKVYTRNRNYLGTFNLDELPLKIEGFELSGKDYDFIQICFDENLDCCKEIEWLAPDC